MQKNSSMINHINIILLLVDKIQENQHFQNLIWTNQFKKTNIKTKYIQLYQLKKSSKIFIHSKLEWYKIKDYRIFQSAVELGLQSHWEFSCHWWPAVRHRLSSEKCWWRSLKEIILITGIPMIFNVLFVLDSKYHCIFLITVVSFTGYTCFKQLDVIITYVFFS